MSGPIGLVRVARLDLGSSSIDTLPDELRECTDLREIVLLGWRASMLKKSFPKGRWRDHHRPDRFPPRSRPRRQRRRRERVPVPVAGVVLSSRELREPQLLSEAARPRDSIRGTSSTTSEPRTPPATAVIVTRPGPGAKTRSVLVLPPSPKLPSLQRGGMSIVPADADHTTSSSSLAMS